MNLNNIIGSHVKYFDYLGFERFGTICHIEPYPYDESVVYVYIEDEDIDYNTHSIQASNTLVLKYSDIRLSTEVYID